MAIVLSVTVHQAYFAEPSPTVISGHKFDSLGRYVLKNFDTQKPMASFLPGIAGVWGSPLWSFYVNRGQGITSFGVANKDGAIAKFNPANIAYQQTPFTGFRTFLKGSVGDTSFTHMPFFPTSSYPRDMAIGAHEMEIQETAEDIGVQTNVLYFTVPDEDFPALVRRTTLTNLNKHHTLHLEVLDGLNKIIPSGLTNFNLDNMGRTMEAWMNVYNFRSPQYMSQPYFHISQDTSDQAQVKLITDGHFVVSFIEETYTVDERHELNDLLPFIVDPDVVFGSDSSLLTAQGFFNTDLDDLLRQPQGINSRTPCALAGTKVNIPPGANVTITSIYGHAKTLDTFLDDYSARMRLKNYVDNKRETNKRLVDSITNTVTANTSSHLLNSYVKQNYLDNVLRGGYPMAIGGSDLDKPKIVHTFSRIHGDIERDYNNFLVDPTYYSQGPGNFRDINQNRRSDVHFSPYVADFNIQMFLSFVQADGYNPLTVAGTNFKVPEAALDPLISSMNIYTPANGHEAMKKILEKPFRIGQLFQNMKEANIKCAMSHEQVLGTVISTARQVAAAQFSQNGYWADHWTYTLDLVESFLSVFPDEEINMLSAEVPFFMSPAVVRPRRERFNVVKNDNGAYSLRVYNAVLMMTDDAFPADRRDALQYIYHDPLYVADATGAGGIWQRTPSGVEFQVTVLTKLLMLGIIKFSTLDPYGMGVEYEGGKPGWNDAMNGLPGIMGSGMPETYEMLRVLQYVKSALDKVETVQIPVEFDVFMTNLGESLSAFEASDMSDEDEYNHWNASNHARELYRDSVRAHFSGDFKSWAPKELSRYLSRLISKTERGITRAVEPNNNLSPTYFYYDCVSYKVISRINHTVVNIDKITLTDLNDKQKFEVIPLEFKVNSLPLFLEGPSRHLKIIHSLNERRQVYQLTRQSELYDGALQMYTISGSLAGMSQEIGRMMAFSAGWLENQSVWLHMSYKFYLQLLLGGLYEEYYAEIITGFVSFMDSDVYGRSPLEASSFIVSSAFPDSKLHGAGFLARLSGACAEFMQMWVVMTEGLQPFRVVEGELVLQLKPILASWLFHEDGTISFTFLGHTVVTYHNPHLLDTWKATLDYAVAVDDMGNRFTADKGLFSASWAKKVRSLKVASIDVFFKGDEKSTL